MKQDEMTICECIEYLDSMVGDNENIKGCLDYIERKAKAMDKKLREYKNIFEEKQGTNFEHFFEYLSTIKMCDLALIGGRVTRCWDTQCSECDVNGDCIEGKFKWLKQPYKKQTYKLSQFEYDLLNTYKDSGMRKSIFNYSTLLGLQEKGYFKGIDDNEIIGDILAKCEVVG
jgi:hypothetical protein